VGIENKTIPLFLRLATCCVSLGVFHKATTQSFRTYPVNTMYLGPPFDIIQGVYVYLLSMYIIKREIDKMGFGNSYN
jgi:hypothetical protein